MFRSIRGIIWYQNILKRAAIYNNSTVSTCLQSLMSNGSNKNIIPRYPTRGLSNLNVQECTVGEIIDKWNHRFEAQGIPEPTESIQHIVAHTIGIKKVTDLLNIRNNQLNANQIMKLESMCERRLLRIPIQYITGEWKFRDIVIKLAPPIFIPWPETEMLIDVVLKRLNALQIENCEILEIGCGSGAISLALAHACKKIKFIAIDANPKACELTMTNRDRLNLTEQVMVINAVLNQDSKIEISDISNSNDMDLNSKSFDFIISNPPYMTTKEISDMEPEKKHYQDLKAMDGGDDGLKIIKPLLKYTTRVLKPGGRLFMEVNPVHAEQIQVFIKTHTDLELRHEHTYKDFANYDRFVEIVKVI